MVDETSNFTVDDYLIWDHLGPTKYVQVLRFFKFKNFVFSNKLRWQQFVYQSGSSRWDLKPQLQ